MEKKNPSKPFTVVIECCQQCTYHSWCSRHNQAKYQEHFNELKKKIETQLPGTIILKNQLPLTYKKLHQRFKEDNRYLDETTGNIVQYPRLGSFEVYADGYLVFSKLESNVWPSHCRILAIIQSMNEQKKNGKDISKFSLQNRINNQSDDVFKVTYNKMGDKKGRQQHSHKKYDLLSRSLQKFKPSEQKKKVHLSPQANKVIKIRNNQQDVDKLKVQQNDKVLKRDISTAPHGIKNNRKFIRPIQKHQKQYELIKAKKLEQQANSRPESKQYSVRVLKKAADIKIHSNETNEKYDKVEETKMSETQLNLKSENKQMAESNSLPQNQQGNKNSLNQQKLYQDEHKNKEKCDEFKLIPQQILISDRHNDDQIKQDTNFNDQPSQTQFQVEEIVASDFSQESQQQKQGVIQQNGYENKHNEPVKKQQFQFQAQKSKIQEKLESQEKQIEKSKIREEVQVQNVTVKNQQQKQQQPQPISRKQLRLTDEQKIVQEQKQILIVRKLEEQRLQIDLNEIKQPQQKPKYEEYSNRPNEIQQIKPAQKQVLSEIKQEIVQSQLQHSKQPQVLQQTQTVEIAKKQSLQQEQDNKETINNHLEDNPKNHFDLKTSHQQIQNRPITNQITLLDQKDKTDSNAELKIQTVKHQIEIDIKNSDARNDQDNHSPNEKALELIKPNIQQKQKEATQNFRVSQKQYQQKVDIAQYQSEQTQLQSKFEQKQEQELLQSQFIKNQQKESNSAEVNKQLSDSIQLKTDQTHMNQGQSSKQHYALNKQEPLLNKQLNQQTDVTVKQKQITYQKDKDDYPVIHWKSTLIEGDFRMANQQGVIFIESSPEDNNFEPIVFDYRQRQQKQKSYQQFKKIENKNQIQKVPQSILVPQSEIENKRQKIKQNKIDLAIFENQYNSHTASQNNVEQANQNNEQKIAKDQSIDLQIPKSDIPQDNLNSNTKIQENNLESLGSRQQEEKEKEVADQKLNIQHQQNQAQEHKNNQRIKIQQNFSHNSQIQPQGQQVIHEHLKLQSEIKSEANQPILHDQQHKNQLIEAIQPPIPPIGFSRIQCQKSMVKQNKSSLKQEIIENQIKIEHIQSKDQGYQQNVANDLQKQKQNIVDCENVDLKEQNHLQNQDLPQQISNNLKQSKVPILEINPNQSQVFVESLTKKEEQIKLQTQRKINLQKQGQFQVQENILSNLEDHTQQKQVYIRKQQRSNTNQSIQPPIPPIGFSVLSCSKLVSTLQNNQCQKYQEQVSQQIEKQVISASNQNKRDDNSDLAKLNQAVQIQNQQKFIKTQQSKLKQLTSQHLAKLNAQQNIFKRKEQKQNTNNSIQPPIPPIGMTEASCSQPLHPYLFKVAQKNTNMEDLRAKQNDTVLKQKRIDNIPIQKQQPKVKPTNFNTTDDHDKVFVFTQQFDINPPIPPINMNQQERKTVL